MTKPKPPASEPTDRLADLPDTPAGNALDTFLASLPADAQLKVALTRTASDLHPHLSLPESCFPPPRVAPLSDMQEEVARRHGPGEYNLTVNYFGPGGRTDRGLKSVRFRIGPSGAGPGGVGGEDRQELVEGPLPAGPLDDAKQALSRALQLRAEAAELETLAGMTGAGRAPTVDPFDQFSKMVTAVRALLPAAETANPRAEMVEWVKVLQGVLGNGGGSPAAETVGVALVHELGGLVGKLVDTLGPYLPNLAQAVAQARPGSPGGPQEAFPVPEATPGPAALRPAPPPLIVALTGGNQMLLQTARLFLDMVFLECQKPHTPETLAVACEALIHYGDTQLPALLDALASMPDDQILTQWAVLDPRVKTVPTAEAFCRALVAKLRETGDVPDQMTGKPLPEPVKAGDATKK